MTSDKYDYQFNRYSLDGHLRLSAGSIDLLVYVPLVTQIHNNLSVKLNTIGLCTYPAESAFCYDSGVMDMYTFSFTRFNPPRINDNTEGDAPELQATWSNKKFKERLEGMVNRWQMETDGCTILYFPPKGADRCTIPASAEKEYTNAVLHGETHVELSTLNGYIGGLTIQYDAGYPDVIHGQIIIRVGSIRGTRRSA